MRSLIKDNKKSQTLSIIAFFAIMLGIFVIAFILMSFVNTILDPFQSNVGNVSSVAGQTVGNVTGAFNKWWDYAVIFLFFLNVIILLVSSFLVDIHPAYLIIYIIAVVILFTFSGDIVGSLSGLWEDDPSNPFQNAVAHMPLTSWILNHFTFVTLGIVVLSGVIMYAKFNWGGSQGPY